MNQLKKLGKIPSLRLNLDEVDESDMMEFENYCKLTGIRKFIDLPNNLSKFI
jgi:hypothetical protein